MTGPALARSVPGIVLAASLSLTACGSAEPVPDTGRTPSGSTGSASPTLDPPPGDGTVPAPSESENAMQIRITIGDQRFTATLDDSAAADDLLAQLPVSVDMVDHGGVEKTGPLPEPLSLDGQPDGTDPEIGDLGYYAPGNDLVLYYGDQSYFAGIVVLGRLDGDAAQRIAALDGAVTAIVDSE